MEYFPISSLFSNKIYKVEMWKCLTNQLIILCTYTQNSKLKAHTKKNSLFNTHRFHLAFFLSKTFYFYINHLLDLKEKIKDEEGKEEGKEKNVFFFILFFYILFYQLRTLDNTSVFFLSRLLSISCFVLSYLDFIFFSYFSDALSSFLDFFCSIIIPQEMKEIER